VISESLSRIAQCHSQNDFLRVHQHFQTGKFPNKTTGRDKTLSFNKLSVFEVLSLARIFYEDFWGFNNAFVNVFMKISS